MDIPTKNVRDEVARAAADQLRALAIAMLAGAAAFRTAVARYDSVADIEATKKQAVRAQAEQDQKTYDALNYRDDQLDLADALARLLS